MPKRTMTLATNGATIRCPAETLIPLVFYPNYRLYVSLVLM